MTSSLATLAIATQDLITATYPMMDSDVCDDPRVVAFIHATNEFADATLGVLRDLNSITESN